MPNLSSEDILLIGKLGQEELRFAWQDLLQLLHEFAAKLDEVDREETDITVAAMRMAGEAARMVDRWRQP